MTPLAERIAKRMGGAGVVLAPLRGTYNEEHGEWDEVKYGPIPVWRRDSTGNPRLLGIPFPRWLRGPRK